MGMGADQGSVGVRQPRSESGTFIAPAPIQGYPSPYFQPSPSALQPWPPGTTTCYDLSSVINFNGLSPQLAYKPITTSSGPRGQYNRNSYPRKNYYNHSHNGPRQNSIANNSSYHYNPHVQQQQQTSLVTVPPPHSVQSVGDSSGYLGGTQESQHYMTNGNSTLNLPSEKGQPAPMFNQRVSATVPYSSSNFTGQPTAHSVPTVNLGLGYQTHSYNSFKTQSQSSEPVVNSFNDSNLSNSYQSPASRVIKQHSRTQQLNHQVPEFVPSNPVPIVVPVIDNVRTSAPTEESNSCIESGSSIPQTTQTSLSGQYNSKVASKCSNSTGKGNRANRRGGHKRDGDNASNCSGTSGQSETYSRNGDERNGHRHRGDRRDHVRSTRSDCNFSVTAVAPPKFDLKDAAFPPLPFSTAAAIDASTSSEQVDVNYASESSDLPIGVNGAVGSLADVVKGISISKSECNKSEASQKSFDSSSNDVIDGPSNIIECNGNGSSDDHGIGNDSQMVCNELKYNDGGRNIWVKAPLVTSHQEQNGGLNKTMYNNSSVCNGHESSDTADQTSMITQSLKSMSFADAARKAKIKQPDEPSCHQRNSVGKESISSVASTVSDDHAANQKSPGQNSKNPNRKYKIV